MKLISLFVKNKVELLENNWFEKFKPNSITTLNKLKIGDSELLIKDGIESLSFIEKGVTFKRINSQDYRYSYKVKNGLIVGLGIRNDEKHITKKDIIKKIGEPDSKVPVIGEIVTIDCFEIECYEWFYNNLRVIFDNKEDTVLSLHFGEKIQYFDQ